MQPKRCDGLQDVTQSAPNGRTNVVLKLIVRNHPGVLSHVCGLFHRRLFNVEGVACLPTADPARSAILLLVRDDSKLEQIERQLAKLIDVLAIHRKAGGVEAFTGVAAALGCPAPGAAVYR
jgi:acetolactate synthase-1/3 small subunit